MTWNRKNPSIELENNQIVFLDNLAPLLPFAIVVTSGTRSYEAQVDAMFGKIMRGENLISLYRDTEQITEIVNAYPNKNEAVEIVKYYTQIGRPISKHLGGLAFDLRINNLSSSQINSMIEAIQSLGGSSILESDHLHVSVPKIEKKSLNPLLLIIPFLIWMTL